MVKEEKMNKSGDEKEEKQEKEQAEVVCEKKREHKRGE